MLNSRAGSSCRQQSSLNLRILVFCLCHFLHIFSGADIAARTMRRYRGQELRHLAEELDQLVDETVNESDPDLISFTPS
jgi:hypothetical protein